MPRPHGGSGRLGTFTQTATALAALGALVFTGVSLIVTQNQNQAQNDLAAQSQYTDRYTKAVDQLGQQGTDRLQIRLGGIYALERLARDSPRDQPTIIEVLSAFVRTNNPITTHDKDPDSRLPTTDTQAALDVLARRDPSHDNNTHIDLRNTSLKSTTLSGPNLVGANLSGANLSGANLSGAYLRGAGLSGADLRGANLSGAYLRGANLSGAYLLGADLSGAYLLGADLHDADLRGADLRGANLSGAGLSGADLSGANLSGANLVSTYLHDADLHDADLRGADLLVADLSSANLRDAMHDANTRIDRVRTDAHTQWW